MIPVTKTFLPPLEEFQFYLQEIWDSNQIANGGKLLFELQDRLVQYLGVEKIILTTNGTLPLQIALKVLACKGEVITTPFSYVATTSTIVWENCTPVFVDIHPEFLTIDETKIEAAITEKTTCILATHVFGNPCNVEEIEKLAYKYNLKVIYDAAHCFGVKYKGESIFNFGDISTCSFHATKIFHTGEGGAMFCKDQSLYNKLFYSHNFGHNGEEDFHGLGINAKMSELQAGMGLSVLPYVDDLLASRRKVVKLYNELLDFTKINSIRIRENTEWNFSYYPVIFENEKRLLEVKAALNDENIFPRRYFYLSLNTIDYVLPSEMKISEEISKKILCLPIFADMNKEQLIVITKTLNHSVNKQI